MATKRTAGTASKTATGTPDVKHLLKALHAAKDGDFTVRLEGGDEAPMGDVAKSFNQLMEMNGRLVTELVRVGRMVGREGRMAERVSLGDVSGSWKTTADSVNTLIADLVQPTTEVARVISAVADGDLTQKIALEIDGKPIKGEFLRIGTTVNTMVDQLSTFAGEVTRVAREVGTEGKLGGQAEVKGVSGTWKDLTDNVNLLAGNLTDQVRNIAKVTTAVANGDLTQKITVEAKGEILELKETVNTMVDQLSSFADEVTRVAREVGTEGKLGGQAQVAGVSGTWKDLTDNVNLLAGNLTDQVRNIAKVTTAVANGDLTQKITVEAKGEILELKETVNTMVDQLSSFADEVTRVAREVGTEGKLGGQAEVRGVSGTWKDLTDNVNFMAGSLTSQVRNIAFVTTAVANGDLSQKITVDAKGEILELKETINTMVDQLSSFADEVTRVAKEVGTEGKLGVQARVPGVAGTWKDLTDNVNQLAGNLTVQLRDVSKVATAIANGDLSQKITVDVRGEILQIKNVINQMVDQLGSFADEVTRVAKEVGTEGKLGVQAEVKGVSGTWKDLTDNVNQLAGNLTVQLRDVSKVATAIANGDLSQKITVDVKGEILQIKNVINQMVDQLSTFAGEVTRVAREVGTEGKLGGQAKVPGVANTWKDLTDNVNFMASNLTDQVRNIALVTTAVANGDLSQKITVDAKGEILELKNTINIMVDQLGSFASEVTRVAREVGTEGKLGGQAQVAGVSGTWKDLTDNVNFMAGSLTSQVRNIALVTTAVANGDLSQKITVDAKGEILELKNTVNTMVDQLRSFASEVTRVAKEVGTEGKLGGQAEVPGVAGTWKDLTDNVNLLAGNLTSQVRNIAKVTTAVANGDLTQKITVEAKGEILELKETVNIMVDQLSTFAGEVTRVAREVGTEGKLGGQAEVKGVSGVWKDLTDNVNFMAGNLTSQVRNIAKVTTAVATGDLTQKITVDAKGEIQELKNTINIMVDQLSTFAGEVTRVAREVGTEGKLGGQAQVAGVSGTWKDLTDNVNLLAGNLTDQVRNIAKVTTAVANGDLSQKITVEAKGEILELKETVNIMVDQLSTFAGEVTRVAREVGTEGKLGGQAQVAGVSGVWKDLTDNVNFMAGNLTDQVRNIALVTTAVANGDLSQKITVDAKGEILELKNTINVMVDQLRSFAAEVTRVAREVGTEGKLGGQAQVPGVSGTWKDLTDNVNQLAGNLTNQVRNIAKVTTAVANGDLSQKITVDAKGEILELKDVINQMVDQLSSFADEVTRVAREVGSEGKLGGQARVPGVAGTWKDLTDNVNFMASNLTDQVRNIAKVTTAVANGDLSQKITVDAKGEILELKNTVNTMVDQLSSFAAEVTRVAREVGIEGKLGGQARVPGVAGTWKDLTDNVNQMAGSLTSQVRAIAEVSTAVTKGDLTRSIAVEAQGEVAELKDNINQMIANLKDTTQKNQEQDWLKSNLAKFSRMMQGQKNLAAVSRLLMSELTPLVSAHHGVFYLMDSENDAPALKLISSYAYKERKHVGNRFRLGEGLVGQTALEKKAILLTKVPGDYIQISSGLGEAPPLNIIVLPVLFEGEVKAVIELASFQAFSEIHQIFLDQLMESVGVVLNMITANMRTEELLQELKKSNSELEAQAKELEEKASLLEVKNKEVEMASVSLEEKAEQLSIISKYKSEFLANMSHELRTPLNSLMILAKLMSDNKDQNLTPKQIEFANTIYAAGNDLLSLINEILDLSKVESGKMGVDARRIPLTELSDYLERSFRHVAQQKGLHFNILKDPGLPANIITDNGRLQQVLRNLLSNAFKFTESGRVSLQIRAVDSPMRFDNPVLNKTDRVVAFSVTDTGIGIPKEKQRLIFEAFQQADGTTSRKYGGTGLGLTISREIAQLLGGEIRVESEPGTGSTFTLYLPAVFPGQGQDGSPVLDADVLTSTYASQPLAPSNPNYGTGLPSPAAQAANMYLTARQAEPAEPLLGKVVEDDRNKLQAGDRVLLIVEDDANFAVTLQTVAHEQGFKCLVATNGEAGLTLARQYQPDAVTLDLQLPGMDGWTVLERLKMDPNTRHIPVQIISVHDRESIDKALGAIAYLEKPVSREALDSAFVYLKSVIDREVKDLLVVEDDELQRTAITELLADSGVNLTAVGSGAEALTMLADHRFDCVVLDLMLPDMSGFELLELLKSDQAGAHMPVIVYTCKDLTDEEKGLLTQFAESVIIKDASAPARLVEETSRFLTRITDRTQAVVQTVPPAAGHDGGSGDAESDSLLATKTVLVVDDDVRNIFALASGLEAYRMHVLYAENGLDGVRMLKEHPEIDLVLMDIMMPEMDGYETMETIRRIPAMQSLPIIALTAKAMPGDREKCLEAGASDYIPKPVDMDVLVKLMKFWIGSAEATQAL